MIFDEVTIPVPVGDDPLLLLRVQKRVSTGLVPYDLSNVDEIEFIVREKTGDEAPLTVYRLTSEDVVITEPLQGRFTVQVRGEDISKRPYTHRRYQVRVREVGLWTTVMAGQLALKAV